MALVRHMVGAASRSDSTSGARPMGESFAAFLSAMKLEKLLNQSKRCSKTFMGVYPPRMTESSVIADPTNSVFSTARDMMRAGLDAAYAFTYVRSDGLLLTELNLDLVSDQDIELFSSLVKEYEEATSADSTGPELNSLAFIAFGNAILRDIVDRSSARMLAVLRTFYRGICRKPLIRACFRLSV